MDDKTKAIIRAKLEKWSGEVIDKDKLSELRDEVYKKTRKNKFAPFSNFKKWIKLVRKDMHAEAKKAGKSVIREHATKIEHEQKGAEPEARIMSLSSKVERSLNDLKEETQQLMEVPMPKPTIIFDKVYLQSIQYEIANIRSMMERINKQLDKLEKQLSSRKED
jgi:hypothetical protein